MTSPESFLSLPLPYGTPSDRRITGRLKVEPEDFVVDEIPVYEPCGEGSHLFLKIRKRDVSAEQLVAHLARVLNLRRDDIGVAGLKDRWAVTTQWVSVPAEAEPKINQIETDSVQVLESQKHGNKLRTGHLRGNRFQIVLRDVLEDSLTIAEQLASHINQYGVPNFYGDQRFGIDNETLKIGLSLLTGESTGKTIPFSRRKFLTRLSLSAVQSALFNSVLSQRIQQQTLHQVRQGEVMQVSASGGLFVVDDVEAEQKRFNEQETVITGPLFGPKMKAPTGLPFAEEQGILDASGLSAEMFQKTKKLTPGGRRPLLIWPQGLQVTQENDHKLRLDFSLPSGAYATVVLREFIKEE